MKKEAKSTHIKEKPGINKESVISKITGHPAISSKLTFGQRASDKLTAGMGSWTFIILFTLAMASWIWVNSYYLVKIISGDPFDPFPFILLNLALSSLAAIQAPIILMSQNRESQKDHIRSEYDYAVNRKAEREITDMKKQLNRIEERLSKKG